MTDKEKAINDLNTSKLILCNSQMITPEMCVRIGQAINNAIALLKEQEPVEAVADGEDSYVCSNCGTVIGWFELDPGGIEEVKYKFCPECGRMVKWND